MLRRESIWKTLDWTTVVIYLLLVVAGWFSVCGASYEYGNPDFLDFSTRAGKQFVWIICSFGLSFVLLMLDDTVYDTLAYLIYIGMMILLVVTIFIAPNTKGSHSWLILGPVSLQPAEFAKFTTALALAKCMNAYSFTIKSWKNALTLGFIILLPMVLIILQRETGSALVYLAFFLVLYREGMPGVILFAGVAAVIYFVVGIRFGAVMIGETPTPVGQFVVLLLILLFVAGMVWVYTKRWPPVCNLLLATLVGVAVAWTIAELVVPFNMVWVLWGLCALAVGYLPSVFFSPAIMCSTRCWNRISRCVSRWCWVWKKILLEPVTTLISRRLPLARVDLRARVF